MNCDYSEVLSKLYKKYNFKCVVKIVDGSGASTHPAELWLGKETIKNFSKEQTETLIIHESFHQIFEELDETEEFKEKDKGNIKPYQKKEVMTWNKVKEEFPEYKEIINNDFICKLYDLTKEEIKIIEESLK